MRVSKRLWLIALALLVPVLAWASVTVTVNGSSYTIPQSGEKGWGSSVTSWIQAMSSNTLQPSGGSFSLTSEVDFGSSYGLKTIYTKSRALNPSTSGVFRLGNAETIGWRNAANGGNLLLTVNSSDQLTFNGIVLSSSTGPLFQDSLFTIFDNSDTTKLLQFQLSGITTGTTRTITMADANVDLSDVSNATSSNSASKIVKRDGSGNFAAGTITANLTGNVTGNSTGTHTGAVVGNADTATALAANPSDCASDTYATTIAANGNLTCATVTNAGLAGSIALTKLATGNNYRVLATNGSGVTAETSAITASRALVSDANGIPTHATTTSTEIGYVNGVTSAIQTQLDAKVAKSTLTTKGDIYVATGSATVVRQAIGSDNQVLTADSAQTNGLKWATPATATVTQTDYSGTTTINTIVNKTTTATTDNAAETYTLDATGGAWTLSLPAAATYKGKIYYLRVSAASANAITVDPNSSETICGQTTIKLLGLGDGVTIQSDGSNWIGLGNSCERVERAAVGSTGTVSLESTDWINGSVSVASAVFTATIQTGIFSAAPVCITTDFGETTNFTANISSTSSTQWVVRTFDTANAASASAFRIICTGPR